MFKVIDSSDVQQKKESSYDWENQKCAKMLDNEEGRLTLSLIREFLQFFNMDYTLSVFQSESNYKTILQREVLAEKINLDQADNKTPLLYQLL